jgi:hypothetical protein
MRIAYFNRINALSAASITASTEDLLYPASNLLSQRLAKPFRTQHASAQTVVIDFGTAVTIDVAAILGHNVTSAATMTIEANATDSWGAPSATASLTWDSGIILRYLASAETFRYWRFAVDDSANDYISIGALWLGEYVSIDPSSTTNFSVTKVRDDTVVYGRGRQKYANEGEGWRKFDLRFPVTDGTALTVIETMYDTVGNHTPLIFANFDELRTYPLVEPCYCSLSGDLKFEHRGYMGFEFALSMEEDL